MTKFLPVQQIELTMNVILVFLAIFLLFKSDRPVKPSNSNLYIGGITSGFIAGIAGTGGGDSRDYIGCISIAKAIVDFNFPNCSIKKGCQLWHPYFG